MISLLFFVIVFGLIGGTVGEFAFNHNFVMGAIIGAAFAIIFHFGGGVANDLSDGIDFDCGD